MLLIAVCGPAWSQGKPANSGNAADTKAAKLLQLREDAQAKRADVVAKNITLSADEAARFWPLFEKFQTEQNAIMDKQLASLQEYVDSYQTLDDARALKLINAQLDRDSDMAALRRKWLAEFQKVLPTRTAVRVIQIDRRLSQFVQVDLSASIPLVR
jgi:hypothetical protein